MRKDTAAKTKLVLTSLTDHQQTDKETGEKLIPVSSVTGRLVNINGYNMATLDTEEFGRVELDTGIRKFFFDEKASALATDAIKNGHKVLFDVSKDDRITSMLTPGGQRRVELDTPKIPYALLTGKENAVLNQYLGSRGPVDDEKYAKDVKAVRNFLRLLPANRNVDDLRYFLDDSGVSRESPQVPKVHRLKKGPSVIGKSKGPEI